MNIWTILCKFVDYFTPKESLGQHAKCPLPPQIRHIHAEVPSEYVIIFPIFMLKCDGKKYKNQTNICRKYIIYSVYLVQNAKKRGNITTGGKYTNNVNPYLKIAMGIQHCPECVM